ncbi:reverse transcriptase [Plakobranchus ocellatus]|uniref:Reverse transcriptase n=1 Tax=Plakobranchus ocellatus TaxID=259542 RepID=A0AAV3YP32_9GAST|nr:reverse transcriptase [Plakobranchus ocellatus]
MQPSVTLSTKHAWPHLEQSNIRHELFNKKQKAMRNGNAAQAEKKPKEANESSTCSEIFQSEAFGLKQSQISQEKTKPEEKTRANFFKDLFQFARQLFQQPKSGTLTAQKEEIEPHLRKREAI